MECVNFLKHQVSCGVVLFNRIWNLLKVDLRLPTNQALFLGMKGSKWKNHWQTM